MNNTNEFLTNERTTSAFFYVVYYLIFLFFFYSTTTVKASTFNFDDIQNATKRKIDNLAVNSSDLVVVPDASSILLWGEESLVETSSILPNNFWKVGFESIDLYEQLIR